MDIESAMDEANSRVDSMDAIAPSYGRAKSSSFATVKNAIFGKSHGSVKSSSIGTVKSATAGPSYGSVKSSSYGADESDSSAVDDQEEDKLSQLVRLQAADGHFIWSDVIAKFCGMSQQKLMAASPSNATEEVWITGLVVAMLEQMVELRDLWELVVRKARKYLENQITSTYVEQLIRDATGLLTK